MGLTKEEKKALKLAKKLEKAELEILAKKLRKRDELDRELAAYDLQQVELNERLQKMMVRAKEPVYKVAIQVMCSSFDRTVDKKDHVINLIMDLKRVADNQYQRTIAGFCMIVDGIVGNFLSDLQAMCKETEIKTEALLQQGEEERNYIIAYQKHSEQNLNILLYHAHELADSLAWTIRGENFVKIDEVTNKYLEIREDLSAFLEGLYTATWEQFKGTLKGYIIGTAENQKQVKLLRQKEMMMANIIASQAKKIVFSEKAIKRLRNELAAYESGTKQAGFRDRRNRHKEACFRLKKCLVKAVDTDEKQLDRLVNVSNDSVKYLESACKKSEKILRMAALCRKLETQYEKVLPYGSNMPQDLTQLTIKSSGRRKPSEDSMVANAISTTCGLTRLWQRISKVELSKRALYKEKMLLEKENADLKRIAEVRGKETLSTQAIKCQCVSKTPTTKRLLGQPHAVDGSLEARKIMRYY